MMPKGRDVEPIPMDEDWIKLPEPEYSSDVSIEETLLSRRSTREYKNEPLTLKEISQLLWAAQGITDPDGLRTAPSAGALYPLEVYVIAGDVEKLTDGIYKYDPFKHAIEKMFKGDIRPELAEVALKQTFIQEAPLNIVITGVYDRTTWKYGERGVRYVHMEAGHAAENLCLQATALDLGLVTVGAFHDDEVKELLNLGVLENPLYIIPVGRK
jgi:SagB-type dehydrogenase family enzyme